MANTTEMTDPNTLSYEEARTELIDTVRQLDSRDIPLEEALTLWERGQKLAQRCQSILEAARNRVAETTQATHADSENPQ